VGERRKVEIAFAHGFVYELELSKEEVDELKSWFYYSVGKTVKEVISGGKTYYFNRDYICTITIHYEE